MWSAGEQALYWVDNAGARLHRFDPSSGRDESFAVDENVMDIGLRAGGGLVVALAKALAFYDPRAGTLQRFADVEADRPDNRFNDGKVDRRGRYWVGSMDGVHWDRAHGALYCLREAGRPELVEDEVVCANGLGWSPDDRTFYLGESFRYTIFAYDFDLDRGTIAGRRAFATVDRDAGGFPDGLTVDADGGVWSAHNGAGRVVRYSVDGEVTHVLDVPVPQPTSVIFGGTALDVLYVTTSRQGMSQRRLDRYPLSGSVFAVRPGVIGLREPSFT
jgi:sugar lactone lactonase YvrE